MKSLILASTSKYRKKLLEQLQIPFTAISPAADEEKEKKIFLEGNTASSQFATQLAQHLARVKAQSLSQQKAIIIGSDQLLSFKSEIIGKGHTPDGAEAILKKLSGQKVELITAVAIVNEHTLIEFTDTTTLHFRELETNEIKRYIQKDNPIDCAGAFKIESLGISLFQNIQSNDLTAIQGLPLMRLAFELRKMNFQIP